MVADFTKQTINSSNPKIYIMIPSLYDSEIKTTILDAIHKATYPERLTFGLSLQGLSDLDLSDIPNEKRILYLDKNIVYGIGQTRFFLQKLHNDEEYILSIDCHTGFKQGWDEYIINRHKSFNDSKAVISQYLLDDFTRQYDGGFYEYDDNGPWPLKYDPSKSKSKVDNYSISNWVAPHFIFATKEFANIDYPYKYFWGHEDHLVSLKLYCNGFTIYELDFQYFTTIPKSQSACNDRTKWFFSALSKHSPEFDIRKYTISFGAIGQDIDIKYDYNNLYLSYHLINKKNNRALPFITAIADLLQNGYSDIIDEDLRNLERSIEQYYEFFGISPDQIKQKILWSRKYGGMI